MLNFIRPKQHKAHIVGYYGMQNSGDDALMHASIWGARHLFNVQSSSVSHYGFVSDLLDVEQQHQLHYHQAFPGQNRLTQYQAAMASSGIIFGGGSVLHSESDINLKRHMMALAGAKNSRAVGVSLGPFQSVASEKACRHFLNECGFVGVRDNESLAIAKDLAPHANVEKTFDLAPLLICAQQHQPIDVKRSGIALALCPVAVNPHGVTDHQAENRRIEQFCHLIQSLYSRTGEHITLLTFNGHNELGDWKINHAIMDRLYEKLPITIKQYNPNPFAVLNELANFKAVISMRLHGSILGFLANTPVISVNYHTKCKGWCEQAGLAKQYQFNLDNLDVEQMAQQMELGLANGFVQPTLAVTTALEHALSNWSITHEQAKFYSRYSAI